jgi:hypothetical protein
MVKERPILFSAPMVRAILAGRKTQTRRPLKYQPIDVRRVFMKPEINMSYVENAHGVEIPHCPCPYGKSGDRLWVRENYWIATNYSYGTDPCGEPIKTPPPSQLRGNPIHFDADGNPPNCANSTYGPNGLRGGHFAAPDPYAIWHKHPSIHMPRWASRINLEITGVRVERLQDISEDDAQAEGIVYCGNGSFDGGGPAMGPTASHAYMRLWNSINGQRSWEANPWVWVIEFKRV